MEQPRTSTTANPPQIQLGIEWCGPLKASQNEVLLSWLEEGFRQRDWAKGPSKKAIRCAIELFQNLTKHAADVSLKVGYDAEDSVISVRRTTLPPRNGTASRKPWRP